MYMSHCLKDPGLAQVQSSYRAAQRQDWLPAQIVNSE